MLPIPIFIGIAERFECIKSLTRNSILANTSADVDIKLLYPLKESGCTGFSDVRFSITKGIYLDCDMVVLGDIADLWNYRKQGRYVCIEDGSTEVAVIDCEHLCRDKTEQHKLPKSCDIPAAWNVRDAYRDGMKIKYLNCVPKETKLFHFTALPTQPWFYNHPNREAVELYEKYNKSNPTR